MVEEKNMSESILTLVKEKIGLFEEDDSFDNQLIANINSVFSILYQLGVGPKPAFRITGSENTWDEFTTDPNLEFVKDYVWMKVKLMFDTSGMSGAAMDSLKGLIQEFEWRLNVAVDPVME